MYAAESFMNLCRETYHWEYLFTEKETRQKSIDESYEWIKKGEGAEKNRCQRLMTLRGLTHRESEENQAENTPNYYTTYYTICP